MYIPYVSRRNIHLVFQPQVIDNHAQVQRYTNNPLPSYTYLRQPYSKVEKANKI